MRMGACSWGVKPGACCQEDQSSSKRFVTKQLCPPGVEYIVEGDRIRHVECDVGGECRKLLMNISEENLMNALFFATEEDFENRVLDKRQLRTILKRNKFPCNWEPRDMTNEFNVVGNQLQDLVEQVNPPFPQEIQGLIAVLKEELYFGPLSLEMAGALFDAFSAECE
eukprot:CAMPEP_0178838700 /NCGR_PEP_ID=MMETSP0746-20121128/13461_1 /TAXON_ID=913974 /ORGANISM="Nitzschia punctata, Strain CCMP561" /LENGTH=167 /DNA_ID=CAMNT_0020501681 /DNA_START=599 /DNA_END=1103 /DNA_ORIENTATION=+